MLANQSKQMKIWFGKTMGTALEVPQAIADEITASFDGIDETKAASVFADICAQVGCDDLYRVYGVLSQTVHPSVSTSNTYIEPSGAFRLTPRLGHTADVQLVAHCLIWAQRAFDRLLPDPSRAQGLQKLASAIQAIPVLPDYQPPAAPAGASGRGRGRRRRPSPPIPET